jgi:uncharacterized membrane protein YesL/GNAT superfamily N-acetyltransferase
MEDFINRYHSKFSQFTDWIYFLVVVNFLAILFSLIGLGIFGFFPALMTTYQLIRKKIENEDFSTFKVFFKTYKQFFVKANQVGLLLVVIWVVLYLSWSFYLSDLETIFHFIGLIIIGFMALATFLVTTYVPISFIYFPRFKTFEHLKFSLLMSLSIPKVTFVLTLNMVFFYLFVFIRFITIFPFLAFSLPAYINVKVARNKLLNIFTIFKDKHTVCLTLNAYDQYLDIWTSYQDNLSQILPMEYQTYLDKTVNSTRLNKRLSVVLLDNERQLIGYQLVLTEGLDVHVQLMWIHETYRKRGYGKQIMNSLENRSQSLGFTSIRFGHKESYFDLIPKVFSKHVSFLKHIGYTIETFDSGYNVIKGIGDNHI